MMTLCTPFTRKCPLIQGQKTEKENAGAIRENSIIKYEFICVVPFPKILGGFFSEKKKEKAFQPFPSIPFHCVSEGILRR